MKVTLRHVQEVVAEHFAVPVDVMTGPRYDPRSASHMPRQVAMFFSRHSAGKSYPDIARRFNRKDHTTAMHAERKIARMIAADSTFAAEIKTISQAIGSVDESNYSTVLQLSERA